MRRSREHAAETRRRIVEVASRLFRARGITLVSIADIMNDLGLTAGGFYRHFTSKAELVAEAIDAASAELVARYAKASEGAAPASALLDSYLSIAHRDHPERGCPVAALCAEVAHADLPTRQAFTRSIQRLVEVVGRLAPGDTEAARDRPLYTTAAIVGALMLSRATSDDALAEDLLRTVRRGVLLDAKPA